MHLLLLNLNAYVCAVCTTNDGRNGGLVFHHEQAQAPIFPSKLFFYCEVPAAPGCGGGTGITPSWKVLDALTSAYPSFIADCEAKGVKYSATLPLEPNTAAGGVGRSWRSFFSVSTQAEAEERMRELGYTWTWNSSNQSLHLTTPVLPAVVNPPGGARRKTFFNQMIAQALSNAAQFVSQSGDNGNPAAVDLSAFLTFGDGSPVPLEPLQFAARVSDEAAVDLSWRKGDVALLDNYLVMHARRPWVGDGPRKVLASLVKGP